MIRRFLRALGYKVERITQNAENIEDSRRASPPLELTETDVQHCRLVVNREALLKYLPRGGVVVEVGVATGDFSEAILRIVQPQHFYAIDLFELHRVPVLWGKPPEVVMQGRTHEEFYADKFRTQIAEGLVTVRKGISWEALEQLPDSSCDMIYIDAAHDYESVKKDAAVACRKIRPDGFLIFNDYIMYDHLGQVPYGVVHVVNELCRVSNFEMLYFALQPNLFCDVALKRK